MDTDSSVVIGVEEGGGVYKVINHDGQKLDL